MIELGVNIDHVATLRQARKTYEPDPVWAAVEAELGGADGITVHLREDRRHINDRDVRLLRQTVQRKLNLEMSLAPEIVAIACEVKPEQVSLVPERRQEVTTEGGLDLIAHADPVRRALDQLHAKGVFTSAFIDPDPRQVEQAAALGFGAVELHTGSYANAVHAAGATDAAGHAKRELLRVIEAGAATVDLGLRLHAGHGLNYHNTAPIAAIPSMAELNIGHAIMARAVFIGLRAAVAEMNRLMVEAAQSTPAN